MLTTTGSPRAIEIHVPKSAPVTLKASAIEVPKTTGRAVSADSRSGVPAHCEETLVIRVCPGCTKTARLGSPCYICTGTGLTSITSAPTTTRLTLAYWHDPRVRTGASGCDRNIACYTVLQGLLKHVVLKVMIAGRYSTALDDCGGHSHGTYVYHYHSQVITAHATSASAKGITAGTSYAVFPPGVFKCWRVTPSAGFYS